MTLSRDQKTMLSALLVVAPIAAAVVTALFLYRPATDNPKQVAEAESAAETQGDTAEQPDKAGQKKTEADQLRPRPARRPSAGARLANDPFAPAEPFVRRIPELPPTTAQRPSQSSRPSARTARPATEGTTTEGSRPPEEKGANESQDDRADADSLAEKWKKESRQWTTRDGKFKVRAMFTGIEEFLVVLQKENGEEVRVRLAQLSTTDQQWVRDNKDRFEPEKPKNPDPENLTRKGYWIVMDINRRYSPPGVNRFAVAPNDGRTPPGLNRSPSVSGDSSSLVYRIVLRPDGICYPDGHEELWAIWQCDPLDRILRFEKTIIRLIPTTENRLEFAGQRGTEPIVATLIDTYIEPTWKDLSEEEIDFRLSNIRKGYQERLARQRRMNAPRVAPPPPWAPYARLYQ